MKRWIASVAASLALTLALGALMFDRWLDEPMEFEPAVATGGEHVFEVPPGSSLGSVANRLAAQGLLSSPRLFSWYGEVTGRAQSIKAGEYLMRSGVTARELLDLLVDGKVLLHSQTIIEGWTVRELLAALGEHEALEVTLSATNATELAKELGMEYEHAEGWFFPDTYRFAKGTTDAEFLQRAHASMREKLERVWAARSPDLKVIDSAYGALTLASIIERETRQTSERQQIAGVFARRLEQGWRLETDPTVIYGLGDKFDGNIRRRDLTTDTPYNTYTRYGLPPTPIALPGLGSLEAAVDPAPGDAMFFVASEKGDGSHTFSATLAEHNKAVRRYLAALRAK